MLDSLNKFNGLAHARHGDPETLTRIAQYEMAFRMQTSVPELTNFRRSAATLDLYGPDVREPGSFAASCLLARRWPSATSASCRSCTAAGTSTATCPGDHRIQCLDTDQRLLRPHHRPQAARPARGHARHLGRRVRPHRLQPGHAHATNYGRDHHPRCFSIWLAGGGVKGGVVHGETDDFSYNIVRDPVSLHDLNATMLHCLGIDHLKFTVKKQGLEQRLTGVEPGWISPTTRARPKRSICALTLVASL
jgi:hypothetical protein